MPTSMDYYSDLLKSSQRQEAAINDMAMDMVMCLDSIHSQLAHARVAGERALAIQQALLDEQRFQRGVEELIYKAEKMLATFRQPGSVAPSNQYFLLTGLLKTIRDEGISTAVIQGRDNKAAFDRCVQDATTLVKALHDHREVKEALAWEKEQRKRLEDQKRKEEEARTRQAEEAERQRQARKARQVELTQRIEVLKGKKKTLSFSDWHRSFFKFAFDMGPPGYFVIGFIWWFCGWLWLPIKYLLDSSAFDQKENPQINGEIKVLEDERFKLTMQIEEETFHKTES